MAKITLDQLKSLGACTAQLEEFTHRFGASVEVTAALCQEHAEVFNWHWAVNFLLNDKQAGYYHSLMVAPWKEDKDARIEALDKYKSLPYSATYEVRNAALEEYLNSSIPLVAKFRRAQAEAFALAYGNNIP